MEAKEELEHKIKVLIVEDDEASTKLLIATLRNLVGEILKTTTGEESVEIFKNNTDIDLILMDIQLPNLNGFEATREIRKISKEVVIFAQTAYASVENKVKAFEAGCNEYITKPIDINELKMLIGKYFTKK